MSNNQSQRFGYAMSYKVSSNPKAENTNMHIGEIRGIKTFSADKNEPFQVDMSYKVSSNPKAKDTNMHIEKIRGIKPFSGDKNEPFQVDMSYKADIKHGENTEYRSIQNQNKVEVIGAGQSVKPDMTYEVEGSVAGQSVKPVMTYEVDGIRQSPVRHPGNRLKDKTVFRDGMSYSVDIKRNM